MSWDAGAIVGKLGLNVSEYAHGMLQAQTIARAFPPIVVDFLENPLLGFMEVAKAATHFLADSISEIAGHFHEVGLSAEKAGVSVEYFSRLSAAAERAGVSAESLGMSFTFLQEHMGLVLEGDRQSIDDFQRLGFSVQWVKEHMNDSEGAMNGVIERMGRMHSSAERTTAAMRLFGRGGQDIVPLLDLGKDKIKAFGDEAAAVGAVVGEKQVKMGEEFEEGTALVKDAWQGIKIALTQPFLELAVKHIDAIKATIMEWAHSITSYLTPKLERLAAWVDAHPKEMQKIFEDVTKVIVKTLTVFGEAVMFVIHHMEGLLILLGEAGLVAAAAVAVKAIGTIASAWKGLTTAISTATAAEIAFDAFSIAGIAVLAAGMIALPIAIHQMSQAIGAVDTSFADKLNQDAADAGKAAGKPGKDGAAGRWNAADAGGVNIENLNVNGVDPDQASSAIAEKIKPHFKAAHAEQAKGLHSAMKHRHVADAVGAGKGSLHG